MVVDNIAFVISLVAIPGLQNGLIKLLAKNNGFVSITGVRQKLKKLGFLQGARTASRCGSEPEL